MNVLQSLLELVNFLGLPREKRRIAFYSEGRNYWGHLGGLVSSILESSDIPVCFISSDSADPGLALEHPNFYSFRTTNGLIRNWLFANLEVDVMVMTMPDLNTYQIKRSAHNVHYVYVQHSLVSLHMIYGERAFHDFDTLFCAGPHHVKEARAIEHRYNLKPKTLVEHGYGRLDEILSNAKRDKPKPSIGAPLRILIAPSWGPKGVIESGYCIEIIEQLLEQDMEVTLRPHSQTITKSKREIQRILDKYHSNRLFGYESDNAGLSSLARSDIMISDWSGAALEYAMGFGKPVLFLDVPRKINNRSYEDLSLTPIEVSIRQEIGLVVAPEEKNIAAKVEECLKKDLPKDLLKHVFNPGSSSVAGAEYIVKKAEMLYERST